MNENVDGPTETSPAVTRVLVCYSSEDATLARRLADGLEHRGFSTHLDEPGGRLPFAGWEEHMRERIGDTDALVFVLSAELVFTDTFRYQLNEMRRWGKRVVPVHCRPVGDQRIPEDIPRSNYVFLEPTEEVGDRRFEDHLERLVDGLMRDRGYSRLDAQYTEMARLWQARGRSSDYLLRGMALRVALRWLSADEPTQEQKDFITESEAAEKKRIAQRSQLFGNGTEVVERPDARPRGSKVFISYRRLDSRDFVGLFYDRLAREFSEDEIFLDVDTIPIGADFKQHMRNFISSSAVVLAVIGKKWANRNWQRHRWLPMFRSSQDYVEAELELALELGVPILPIIVDNASMPGPSQLPSSIRQLATINAALIRAGADFDADIHGILKQVRSLRDQGSR